MKLKQLINFSILKGKRLASALLGVDAIPRGIANLRPPDIGLMRQASNDGLAWDAFNEFERKVSAFGIGGASGAVSTIDTRLVFFCVLPRDQNVFWKSARISAIRPCS